MILKDVLPLGGITCKTNKKNTMQETERHRTLDYINMGQ